MANSAIAAPHSSTGVMDRAKNRTSQAKLSVGCNKSASPACVVVTWGRLLVMNSMPTPCDNTP